MKKFLAVIALAFAAAFALVACSSSEPITVGADTVVIDVRTPAEYAEGHLEGALNIDVQSPDFGNLISQLPTDGDYIIYCRSGNRSAQAIEIMKGYGFTNLTDAKGLNDASASTGLPIVQ